MDVRVDSRPPVQGPEQRKREIYSNSLDRTLNARDVRTEIARGARPRPNEKAELRAFLESKRRMIRAQPHLTAADRERALGRIDRMEAAIESAPEPEPQGDGDGGEPADDEPPLPGGVGFGVFYHPTYKTAFETGTAAEYTVICPTRPGGNVHSWLYLAATNRAARCPEAVVAYHGQDEFVFAVFDWARPEHWQAPLSPPQIREYLHEVVLDGSAYPALHVLTFTEQSGDGRWRNEVYLRHPEVGTFDMIHAFEYGATVVDQHLGWEGSWGPIIETFQGRYRDTEELGFACFSVASRGAAGWEPWERLSPTDTFVARDDAGFRMLYLEPNHTFVAAA